MIESTYLHLDYNYKGSINSSILIQWDENHNEVSLFSGYNEKMFEGSFSASIDFMYKLKYNEFA